MREGGTTCCVPVSDVSTPETRRRVANKNESALMDIASRNRIVDFSGRVIAHFSAVNWRQLGLLTGQSELITNHHRLLRSLSFGDEDYDGNVLDVLEAIINADFRTLPKIESYVDKHFPGDSQFISAKPSERRVTFAPHVFQLPDCYVELDMVAVMMPFAKEFDAVYQAIKNACQVNNLRCVRADDIWEEATIIQDIFNLIFRSQVVVVDFTGKNPNVMYETGIAHTLGEHVVPITQHLSDVPFDMQHHRALRYLCNNEGLKSLEGGLTTKLKQFAVSKVEVKEPSAEAEEDAEDIPF